MGESSPNWWRMYSKRHLSQWGCLVLPSRTMCSTRLPSGASCLRPGPSWLLCHSLNLGFLQILETHRLAQFEACGLHTSQDVNVTTNALQCHMVRHLHREPQEFMSQEILSYLTCFMTSYWCMFKDVLIWASPPLPVYVLSEYFCLAWTRLNSMSSLMSMSLADNCSICFQGQWNIN